MLEFFAGGTTIAGLAGTRRAIFGAQSAVLDGDADALDGPLASRRGTAGDGLVAYAACGSLGDGTKKRAFAKFGGFDLGPVCFDGFAGLVDLFRTVGETGEGRLAVLSECCASSVAGALGRVGIAREEAVEVRGAKGDATHGATTIFVDASIADVDFDADAFVFVFFAFASEDLGGSAVAVFSVKEVAGFVFFDGDHAGLFGIVGGVGMEGADLAAWAIRSALAGFVAARLKFADAKAVETGFTVALFFGGVDIFLTGRTKFDVGDGGFAFVSTAGQRVIFGVVAFAELAFVPIAGAALFGADQAGFFPEGFVPADFAVWAVCVGIAGLDAAIIGFGQFDTDQSCFAIALLVATGRTARLTDIPSVFRAFCAFAFDAVYGWIDEIFVTTCA